MGKFTKEQLEDMDIWELEKLSGLKGVTKEEMIAKLLPKKNP